MTFSDLIKKMAAGQPLSMIEQQEVYLQARRMEQAESLLTSLIQPGTKILTIDGLITRDAKIDSATITDATITDATIESPLALISSCSRLISYGREERPAGILANLD